MNLKILQIKTYGIKNIDKEITLNFGNKTKNNQRNSITRIKAIYGPNGSGKSAIIHSIKLFQDIIVNGSFLAISNSNNYLEELINKIKKEFMMEIVFTNIKFNKIFSYKIIVKKDNDKYYISEERMSEVVGRTINENNFKTIYFIKDGIIEKLNECPKDLCNEIKDASKNLLKSQSLTDIIVRNEKLYDKLYKIEDFYLFIASTFVFVDLIMSLEVITCDDSVHDIYIYSKKNVQRYTDWLDYITKLSSKKVKEEVLDSYINRIDDYTNIVQKDKVELYKQKVKRLEKFLKIFKSDLLMIDIDIKDNKDVYVCENILVYGDYKIHVEFESTGIRKLISLFDAFEKMEQGNIVFIDEFDANIHDVYFCKLIEYFQNYTSGQLCFTTHNISLMEILRNSKHSIDFLSNDSIITEWKKNGNYSAANLYKSGMIENSPFNIESIDFLGIFSDNDEVNGE